tara:strand:+ start:820 stop:1584 length:765 start_codon:yes stop_codon:yes gene_type:complete
MDKIMPQIQMPTPEPAVVENILPPSDYSAQDKELIEQLQEDLIGSLDDDEPEFSGPEITTKNIPEEDDVFGSPKAPKVRPVKEDKISSEYPAIEEETKGKRKYTRKAPMSEKQKLHLEKIRTIAAEKRLEKKMEKEILRKQKEETKEQEKEESRMKKAEERVLAKQRQAQEEINNPPVQQASARSPTPQMGYSRDDMEKAMFSAISSYETIRKKEKEEKKVRQLAEARENQMKNTLHRAMNPQAPPDPWRQYFS